MGRRRNLGKCSYEGCTTDVHAKGLCRKHYGRKWRGVPLESRAELKVTSLQVQFDRRSSLQADLHEAQSIYSIATGMDARMKWRKRIQELQCALSAITTCQEDIATIQSASSA